LQIKDFPNLTRVHCSNNRLTKLSIIDCPKIEFLNCGYNELTDLSFLDNLSVESLINLSVEGNNFPEQDLSAFSKFVNLKNLDVGNKCFSSSLKPLKDLKKLERLHVYYDVTDLEYLPSSLKKVYCKGTKLAEQLKGHSKNDEI